MLRTISLLALALIFTPALSSQQPYDACNPDPDALRPNQEMQRAEILNLEKETARAIMLNNATFFRRVYGEDFSGTLSEGQTVDKTHLINVVQNSGARYQSFTASDIQVKLFQETAIATCLWTLRGTYQGRQIETQMRVMHVYVNGPRGWHVVSGQNTPLPPYGPHPL